MNDYISMVILFIDLTFLIITVWFDTLIWHYVAYRDCDRVSALRGGAVGVGGEVRDAGHMHYGDGRTE